MKKCALTLLATILFSQVLWARDVVLSSRNMPNTCDLVFAVESDLKLEIPLENNDTKITYQLQNSWAPFNWTEPKTLDIKESLDSRGVEWSFSSMSIPGKYLYRNILITFPESKVRCISEFGRQFGEACIPGGRNSTPWRVRVLNCEDL